MTDNPGDIDLIRCHKCGELRSRNVMNSREIKNKKGTSMCAFFCPKCK